MSYPPSSTLPDRSRLVRLLLDMSDGRLSTPEFNLALDLARLIGITDSISLAGTLKGGSHRTLPASNDDVDKVREDLLRCRQHMILFIINSFTEGNDDTRLQAPGICATIKPEALLTFEPHRRFYIAHQTEMALGIGELRQRIRKKLAGASHALCQLAELDQTLDGCLVETRKLFDIIPKYLEQRFKGLLAHGVASESEIQISDWLQPNGWLALFHSEMRAFLLAEFDARLQPVLGLIEALNEHIDTTS